MIGSTQQYGEMRMEKQNQVSDRRRFVRKLLSLAAVGSLAPLLLGERVEKAYAKASATPMTDHGTTGSFLGIDNNNQIYDNYCVITGGINNTAGADDGTMTNQTCATVGGGEMNKATGSDATVGGGGFNTASGSHATVGGGDGNQASNSYATVGGGDSNKASNSHAMVGGGYSNEASGLYAMVPGGERNLAAGDHSFAAGTYAKVNAAHDGSFLFADQKYYDFKSAAGNEFAVRATGGFRFVAAIDSSGKPTKQVTITPSAQMGINLQPATATPTSFLDVNGLYGYHQLRLRKSFTPASSSDTHANVGDVAWDNSYFYVKTSAGWKRAALTTF
jgi:hypothetical protein